MNMNVTLRDDIRLIREWKCLKGRRKEIELSSCVGVTTNH